MKMASACCTHFLKSLSCLFAVPRQRQKTLLVPILSTIGISARAPSRTHYANWRMLRDVKRRRLFKEYGAERRRLNCIRKNTILPDELKEIADREIAALPRDSCWVRQRNRCAITSRPRAVIPRWRLSRIMWRQIADASHMSGVKRSSW